MIEEHAELAPSSAPIWGNCSGSVNAQKNYPDAETEESRIGTAVHWVAEQGLIICKQARCHMADIAENFLDVTAPNGVVIDAEMVDGAQMFVDEVGEITAQHNAWEALLIEERVHMPQIHPTKNWGTFDAGLALLHIGHIYLWDYKNGHAERDPQGDFQLIDYMAGLVEKYQINGLMDQKITAHLSVVQPFCYTTEGAVRTWSVPLSDLRGEFNHLQSMAHASEYNPTFTAGKHCRYCKAVGNCATARRATYSFVDFVRESYQLDGMTAVDLARERNILKDGVAVAKARLDAIQDQLKHELKNGTQGTGLALGVNKGRTNWSVPPKKAEAIARQFGAEIGELAVKTPTQAVKLVPRELRPHFKQMLPSVTRAEAGSLTTVNADETISARAFKRK